MSNTTKSFTEYDQTQIFQKAYNKEEGTIAIGSFVAGKVGHKIVRVVNSTTVDDFSYYDGAVLLYTLRVTYNNAAHDEVDQVERIV